MPFGKPGSVKTAISVDDPLMHEANSGHGVLPVGMPPAGYTVNIAPASKKQTHLDYSLPSATTCTLHHSTERTNHTYLAVTPAETPSRILFCLRTLSGV